MKGPGAPRGTGGVGVGVLRSEDEAAGAARCPRASSVPEGRPPARASGWRRGGGVLGTRPVLLPWRDRSLGARPASQ